MSQHASSSVLGLSFLFPCPGHHPLINLFIPGVCFLITQHNGSHLNHILIFFIFYVFSIDGALCIVTTVEPLVMLTCSATSEASIRGKRNPFSKVLGKCAKPPKLVLPCTFSIGNAVVVVVEVVFFRGLLEVPLSILLVCIFL